MKFINIVYEGEGAGSEGGDHDSNVFETMTVKNQKSISQIVIQH